MTEESGSSSRVAVENARADSQMSSIFVSRTPAPFIGIEPARLRNFLAHLILILSLSPAFQAAAHEEQVPLTEITVEQRLNAQLPLELEFVDESGGKVILGEYFNSRPVLLAFVYYQCAQVCPLVLDGLVRSLRVLSLADQDYEVVIVSIDPAETHTIAASKKQQYLTRLTRPDGAPRWHFLTGEAASIERLTRAAGFRYAKEPKIGKTQYIHPAVSLVLTPGGRISHYLNGFDYAPKDLRFALIEASDNRIGSQLDHLLLLCYQYDPARGKYTLAILNVLRLSGIATVLSIGVLLAVLLRRERAKRPLRGLP
jgi:protein SCO1/2